MAVGNERITDMKKLDIWHVANAGVIIKLGGLNIGVDILCDKIDPYKETPEHVEKQVLDPDYCPQLDYVFITHEHPDHFNRHKVIEFLLKQPRAKVISNEVVNEELRGKIDATRLILVSNSEKETLTLHKGIKAEIFHSTHMGTQYKNIVNLCMIITWEDKKILIPGDAEPREILTSNRLADQKLDFLIVPFPYITLNSVRKLVKEKVQPEQIMVIHLPAEDHDKSQWISRSKVIYQKEAVNFPTTTFGECLGKSYEWVWDSVI